MHLASWPAERLRKQASGAYLDSETQRQTPLSIAANDKAVHSEDSGLSDDGGQCSSDGSSDLGGGDGRQMEERSVAYNKEDRPVGVGIS